MSDLPIEIAVPNWAEITTEPQCPLCEYMLRGLSSPRCPECGYRFDWAEVLHASQRDHPYLFEHHPERKVWSFFKTMFGAICPRRFWAQLNPSQYGSRRRLIIYWLLGFLICSVAMLLLPIIQTVGIACYERYFSRYAQAFQRTGPLWAAVADSLKFAITRFGYASALLVMLGVIGLWPWLTYVALQVFSISMRKAKVKPIHVLRCVLYSIDAPLNLLLMIIVSSLNAVFYLSRNHFNWRISGDIVALTVAASALAVIGTHTYRLGIAYQHDLRFDHPFGVAVSAQVISFLATAVLCFSILMP